MNKTIHYCHFGRGEIDEKTKKYIESWVEFFPDFTLKEWNEDNFDIGQNSYASEAYAQKKYAFVSDYARFKILYDEGGLYLDTDVEVVAPFDDLLANDAFVGFEDGEFVNPGSALWAKQAGNPVIGAMLELYGEENGLTEGTVCVRMTELLKKLGLREDCGKPQHLANITVYPADYFSPFDDTTGRLNRTANTRSVHWYAKSWFSLKMKLRNRISRLLHRIRRRKK